ncbi:MAG: polysaccharide deacetylase family protein [Bacteroidota bacterium]
MYHKVSLVESEGLTISASNLEAQFQFFKEQGYRSYHLSELAALQKLPSKKSIVLTFDDGYVNQLELALPLLQKYHIKATFFIPLKYMGKEDSWNENTSPIMDAEVLRSLDPTLVELAYHSYAHRKYHEMTPEEVDEDTKMAFQAASSAQLPLNAFLAYPYGKFPRKNPEKEHFFEQLKAYGFQYALRIGNRLNNFPFKDPYEIQRIDVKGEWSLKKFRKKIRLGKRFLI